MAMSALKGIESLKPKKKAPVVEPKPVVAEYVEVDVEEPQPVVVRVPRTTTSAMQKTVDKLSDGAALIDDDDLGKSAETQARRIEVMAWMLNGHTYEDVLMNTTQLAAKLNVPRRTIDTDISSIKDRMAKFYTEGDDTKDIAALAHMLLEMKFQDRGRALSLYNQVLKDIADSDAAAAKREAQNRFSKSDGYGKATGRDRAAMYTTALSAIELANRTTTGMESLLKITGGAQKLQLIIKAKNLHLQQNNLNLSAASVQDMVQNLMAGVLPSNRKQNPELKAPKVLELTAEDDEILAVGEEARKAEKRG